MAGMLAGVECARRRRFHQSGGGLPDSPRGGSPADRRSSFCLYARNSKPIVNSTPFTQRSSLSQAYCDEKLEDVAKEAKERLDEKLRVQPKSLTKRVWVSGGPKQEGENVLQQNRATTIFKELVTEVVGMKKNGSKRLMSWAKLMWKSTEEEEECAVCLEQLKEGETLINLPCAHSFHYKCVVPWLHNNSHCPCCRLEL